MTAIRKPKRATTWNVYYLFNYVDQGLASNQILWRRAADALGFQQKQLDYDNQCYANNQCPVCDGSLEAEERK